MNKSLLTEQELNQALDRVISGKTIRIAPERKLSVKSVEEEAGLGDGTAYYYQGIIDKIKSCIAHIKIGQPIDHSSNEIKTLREKLKKESKLKNKYRVQIKELNLKLSLLAAQNNEFAISIQQYQQRILELESDVRYIKNN